MSIEPGAAHQWAAEEGAHADEGQMSADRDLEGRAIKQASSQRGVIWFESVLSVAGSARLYAPGG